MGRQIRDEVAGGAIESDRLSAAAPSIRPRYQQIVAALRKEIEDNRLKAGDMLPSEAELRERFSVSRHTIREALRALRDEGFVELRQGAATRVTKPENAIYTYSVSDVAELLQYATDVRYEIDKTSVVVADAELASRLACTVGSRWLRVEGFRYVKGTRRRCAGPRSISYPNIAASRFRSAVNAAPSTRSSKACTAFGWRRSTRPCRPPPSLPRLPKPSSSRDRIWRSSSANLSARRRQHPAGGHQLPFADAPSVELDTAALGEHVSFGGPDRLDTDLVRSRSNSPLPHRPQARPSSGFVSWSGRRESNPRMQLGKLPFYH